MPTARPSIAARVIDSSLSGVTEVASMMPRIPKPTPSRAVSNGRPAAIIEPKVIASTRTATQTPSSSPIGKPSSPPCPPPATAPAYSTRNPASSAAVDARATPALGDPVV